MSNATDKGKKLMKWSYSAHRTLRRCQRQFAFDQIVAPSNSHDPLRREAFLLKQLQSLFMWQGDIVHEVIAGALPDLLKRKDPVDLTALIKTAESLVRHQYAFSATRKYRTTGLTKSEAGSSYCALVEHEPGRRLLPDALSKVEATIRKCLAYFAQSGDLIQRLRVGRDHKIEEWSGFSLDDTWVSVKLDLSFLRPDRQPTIVDWKVANSETSDYAGQLGIYALAVTKMGWWKNIQPEAIELYEVNLLRGEIHRHRMDAERLDAAEDLVYRSSMEMKTLFGSRRYADLDLDELDVAGRPGTCATCNYAKLCLENLAQSGRVADVEMVQARLI